MRLSIRDSNSGQAVIEYVLLIMVTILIVFGVVYQFNTAFQKWGRDYFADYLACLLETGELPLLGATETFCSAAQAQFSLADGRTANGANPNSGSGGGENPGDANSDGPEDEKDANDQAKEGSSRGGTSSGRLSRSSRGSRQNSFRSGGDNERDSEKSEGSGQGKKAYTGSTEDSLSGALGGGGGRGSLHKPRRSRDLAGGYYYANDDREKEQIERAPIKIEVESTQEKKETRFIVKEPPPKTQVLAEDRPMEFGDYFRYIIIVCIILALVIVAGSQLVQMSDSD